MNRILLRHAPDSSLQEIPKIRGVCHISQIVFWLELICYMVCMTWYFTYHVSVSFLSYNQMTKVLELVTVAAIVNIFFLCGYSRQQLLEIAALLLLFALARYNSHNDDGFLLYSMAIALSCRRVHPDDLIRKLFTIYVTILLSVLLLFRIGIFSAMDFNEGRPRLNLGFSHYNTLGMVIFCIILLWILLRYERFCLLDYVICLAAGIFVWEVPNSRTAALSIILLTAGVLASKNLNLFRYPLIRAIMFGVFPAMAIFSYLSSKYCTPDNKFLLSLDKLLSGRLQFGYSFLEKYRISLFGQYVQRINDTQAKKYHLQLAILDNGYLRILLSLGIITFLILILIFTYDIFRALKKKHYAILIGLSIIAFYNVSEFYMTNMFANPLLFFFTYYRYGYTTETANATSSSIEKKRNRSMKEYSFYGKLIDMKQYVHYAALHWFSIALAFILAAAIACGLSLKDQTAAQHSYKANYPEGVKEITLSLTDADAAAVQQYLTDSRLLESYASYNENSLYMAIDANNALHYSLTYTFSCPQAEDPTTASNTARSALNAMVLEAKTDDFYENLAAVSGLEENAPGNLRELLTVTTANNTQVTVEILAPNETTLDLLSQAFTSVWENESFTKTAKNIPDFQMTRDSAYQYTGRDTKVRDTQANILNQINTYTTKKSTDLEKLTDNAKQYLAKYEAEDTITLGDPITYTQEVPAPGISKKKAVLSGVKAGLAAIVIILLIWLITYMFTNRIWGRRTMERSYRIPRLGSFIPDITAERAFLKLNRPVWKHYIKRNSRNGLANQEMTFSLRCVLGLTGEHKLRHLVVLSDSLTKCPQMTSQLQDLLSGKIAEKVTLLSGSELVNSSSPDAAVPENVDAVLLAPVMGRSTYAQMEHLLELSSLYQDKVLGYIMVE